MLRRPGVPGFGVQFSGLGFRVSVFGSRFSSLGGSGVRVSGFGIRDSGFAFTSNRTRESTGERLSFRVPGLEYGGLHVEGGEARGVSKVDIHARVSGFGFQVSGFGFQVSGFEFRSSVKKMIFQKTRDSGRGEDMWRAVNPAESARLTSAPCRSTSAFICERRRLASAGSKRRRSVSSFAKHARFSVSARQQAVPLHQRLYLQKGDVRRQQHKNWTFGVSMFEKATFRVSSCETCAVRCQNSRSMRDPASARVSKVPLHQRLYLRKGVFRRQQHRKGDTRRQQVRKSYFWRQQL